MQWPTGIGSKATVDFELLTPQQSRDLDRLKNDRNLCAHPAFTMDDLLFQPTAEQVRTHIVHAIEYLLRQPPVQGRSALLRLKADILQPSFPSAQEAVNAFMDRKYFDHSKESLKASIHSVLLRLLVKQNDADLIPKTPSILQCVIAFRNRFQTHYDTKTPDLLRRLTDDATDEELARSISLLSLDRKAWEWLSEHSQIRLRELASKLDPDMKDLRLFVPGIKVPDLRPIYLKAFEALEEAKKETLISRCPQDEFCDAAIEIYSRVANWRMAERILEQVILPLGSMFTLDQVKQICDIVVHNTDVRTAHGTPGLLVLLLGKTTSSLPATSEHWLKLLQRLGKNGTLYYTLKGELVRIGLLAPDVPTDDDEKEEG